MGASPRPQGIQAPGATSDCLLEVPYEAYMDSPELQAQQTREVIPGQVGRTGKWGQAFAGWIPSFSPRRRDEDDDLPLLTEDPSQRKSRSCRSRYLQYFKYSLLVFFVML